GGLEMPRREKELSVAVVAALREAVGPDIEIFIEVHGRVSASTAIELARVLEAYQPGWIEEPCIPEDVPALKKVAAHTNLPIATGERCFTHFGVRAVLESGAVDIFQPDPIHAGVILDMKKIAAMAEPRSVLLAAHT